MTFVRRAARWCAAALLIACAGSQPEPKPPSPVRPGSGPTTRTPYTEVPATEAWPVKTRYVIDLWLHGFAMITDDTAKVPIFRRGYRDFMVVEKNKRQILTLLDSDHDSLAKYLVEHPYVINSQFFVLGQHEWDVMYQDIQAYLQTGGDPRKVKGAAAQQALRPYFGMFPGSADRKFLAMFAAALQDEHTKFYQAYWRQVEAAQRPVLAAVDTLWDKVYLRQFRRFQQGAELERGEIYLSLPLGGEGRTMLNGKRENVIAVLMPDSAARASEMLFVVAHEAVGNYVSRAVGDNTTPNEKKSGLADRYTSAASVRGGALVIERIAPTLLTAYQGYYLRAAGVNYPAARR